jgi:hypothetical protein
LAASQKASRKGGFFTAPRSDSFPVLEAQLAGSNRSQPKSHERCLPIRQSSNNPQKILTVGRRNAQTGILDWVALLVVGTATAVELTFGLEAAISPTGLKFGYSPGPYFFLGSVALLATVGDIRMLVRGGISGTSLIARHLWRMCFALFIAAGSLFLARPHLFPVFMRKTGVFYMLSILPLIVMIFWLVRMRVRRRAIVVTVPIRQKQGGAELAQKNVRAQSVLST